MVTTVAASAFEVVNGGHFDRLDVGWRFESSSRIAGEVVGAVMWHTNSNDGVPVGRLRRLHGILAPTASPPSL